MPVDIFSTDNIESILRQRCIADGVIDLSKYNMPPFELSSEYKIKEIHLPKKDYDSIILSNIQKMLRLAQEAGFNKERLKEPVYEACRNAHQHGNKLDPNKKILLGYNIIPNKSLDIVVIDEGGKFDPDFIPYILRHRQGLHRTKYIDFYTFSNKPKTPLNLGAGTTLIHTSYLDEIHYYKSENNGLVLHLIKRK